MEYHDIEYYDYDYVLYPFDGGNLSWNSSLNYTDYYYDYKNLPEFSEFYVLPTVFIIICIQGILGNGLVVYLVCRNGPMKTVTNMYLVNLALADLLFLVISVPFTASIYIMKTWSFGQSICKY